MKILTLLLILDVAASAKDITISPGDPLEKARDEARAGDRIVLRGGTYTLNETLVLGAQNSGVTWIAAPGENPVISGGDKVTGWAPDGNGIWKARLDRKVKLRQLYVNGQPATMAEGPTRRPTGWYGEFTIKGNEPWAADGPAKAPDGVCFLKADLPKLSNPADLELQQQSVWTIQRVGVRGIEDDGQKWAVLFDQPAAAGKLRIPDLTKSNQIPPADGAEVDKLYRDMTRWILGGLQDHLNGLSLAKYPVNPEVLRIARESGLLPNSLSGTGH